MQHRSNRAGPLGSGVLAAAAVQAAPLTNDGAAIQNLKSQRQKMGLTGSDIGDVIVRSAV